MLLDPSNALPITASARPQEPIVEVTTEDSSLDLVAGRSDAGIHLGEFIERDMVAVRLQLQDDSLVRVLEDWCEPFARFFLYYPIRKQHPAALTALIDTLRVHSA